MMPEYFALGDLQQVYEVILNKKLLDPAFRRIIADKVEKTEKNCYNKNEKNFRRCMFHAEKFYQ